MTAIARRNLFLIVNDEGMGMTTSAVAADWVKRIADDERRRDAARVREDEAAARKADLIRRCGRGLLDELRAAVTRDVEAFRNEFAGDLAREVLVDVTAPHGGFVVCKPAPSAVSLTVAPNLEAAVLVCAYRFTLTDGLPAREDRVEVSFVDDGSETLRMKQLGTGRVFPNTDALSEFLLVSVLTGRPR